LVATKVVAQEPEVALAPALAPLRVQSILSWVMQQRGLTWPQTTSWKQIQQRFLHLKLVETQEQFLVRSLAPPQRLLSEGQHLAGLPMTRNSLWRLLQCGCEPQNGATPN